jgi:cohesin complex subunit SA-1/2
VETVAEQWLTQYRENSATALAELINCILQCSGCELSVTEDDIRDQENIPGRLTDLQNVWQDVSVPLNVPMHTEWC